MEIYINIKNICHKHLNFHIIKVPKSSFFITLNNNYSELYIIFQYFTPDIKQ